MGELEGAVWGDRGGLLYFLWPKATFFTVRYFVILLCVALRMKSDVVVAAARYELVHISTTATVTSRLPKADTHNEMYFYL